MTNQKQLEASVISTIIRYKTEGVPGLTLFEIFNHLISLKNDVASLSIFNIYAILKNSPLVACENGFYSIAKSNKNFFEDRIALAKIAGQKIKKGKKISRLLRLIPFVKNISISGSVSMSCPKTESDIDLFIIAKKNRIWTTRLLSVFLTHLSGQRRYKNKIADRICLNLYIADENTVFPIQNIASSHMISKILPIYGKVAFAVFVKTNKHWITRFINNFEKNFALYTKPNNTSKSHGNPVINILEKTLKNLLSKRMRRNTPFAKPPNLIADDSALIFYYPHSKNQEILNKYNQALALYSNKI